MRSLVFSMPLNPFRGFWTLLFVHRKCWYHAWCCCRACLPDVRSEPAVGPASDIFVTDTEQSHRLTVPWHIRPKPNVVVLDLTKLRHLGKCSQAAAGQVRAKRSGSSSSLFVSSCCLRIISILAAHFWHDSDIQERSEVVGLHPYYRSSGDCSCWSIKGWGLDLIWKISFQFALKSQSFSPNSQCRIRSCQSRWAAAQTACRRGSALCVNTSAPRTDKGGEEGI